MQNATRRLIENKIKWQGFFKELPYKNVDGVLFFFFFFNLNFFGQTTSSPVCNHPCYSLLFTKRPVSFIYIFCLVLVGNWICDSWIHKQYQTINTVLQSAFPSQLHIETFFHGNTWLYAWEWWLYAWPYILQKFHHYLVILHLIGCLCIFLLF